MHRTSESMPFYFDSVALQVNKHTLGNYEREQPQYKLTGEEMKAESAERWHDIISYIKGTTGYIYTLIDCLCFTECLDSLKRGSLSADARLHFMFQKPPD